MSLFRRRMQDSVPDGVTYVAHGSKFTGTLMGKGAFVFCGEFEGDCDIEGPVTLAAGGRWLGTLKGTDVVIAGSISGDVIASQRVEIAGTARIAGSLSGQSVAVAEGAIIEGEIKVTSGEEPQRFEEKRQIQAQADAA